MYRMNVPFGIKIPGSLYTVNKPWCNAQVIFNLLKDFFMKRLMLFSTLLCTITTCCVAQLNKSDLRKTSFFAGPQVSIAAADLAKTHTWGIGVTTQVAHRLTEKNSLVGRVDYNYFFGKKITYGDYEPGGGSSTHSYKNKGMSDLGITAGIRHDFTENWFGGADGGLCVGFSDGHSHASYKGQLEAGYYFGGDESPLVQALAAFFGLCGDPEIQVGIRYFIKLN